MIYLNKKPTVEAVVINYRRPENIAPILRRFREQTYPCVVTLIDQTGGLDPDTYKLAHRVYSLRENYGGYNRFVPMGNYHCDYTYFHDNDMLPGQELIQYFTTHAQNCPSGALFGQSGRDLIDGNKAINCVENSFTPVSMIVRCYFLRTKYLHALLKFSRYFIHPVFEEDIILVWSLYTYTNKLVYLPPKPVTPSECMNEKELPDRFACWRSPGRRQVRLRFWGKCESISQKIRKRIASRMSHYNSGGYSSG